MIKQNLKIAAMKLLGFLLVGLLVAGCQSAQPDQNKLNEANEAGVPRVNGPTTPPFVNGPTTTPPSYKAATERDTMEYSVPGTSTKSE